MKDQYHMTDCDKNPSRVLSWFNANFYILHLRSGCGEGGLGDLKPGLKVDVRVHAKSRTDVRAKEGTE